MPKYSLHFDLINYLDKKNKKLDQVAQRNHHLPEEVLPSSDILN